MMTLDKQVDIVWKNLSPSLKRRKLQDLGVLDGERIVKPITKAVKKQVAAPFLNKGRIIKTKGL